MTATATAADRTVAPPPEAPTALPPGPPASRAWQTVRWIVRPLPFLEQCRRRFGDTFTLEIAHEGKWVVISSPDDVAQVFKGDPRVFHAGEGNHILLPLLGRNSVLLLDEAAHIRQRKLLLPPFHGTRMSRYGELMTEVARAELARWPRGEPLALLPRMQAVTLEVILRAVFGIEEGERLAHLRDVLRRRCSARSSGAAARTSPSARTSSRCCSRRATRTAGR